MTIAQFFVAYAVCWWLVLFMVLPSGVKPVANPGLGHVPSAPANPRLKRKFGLTTLIAIVPTVMIYFVATAAKAEDAMYTTRGGDCDPLTTHVPSADLNVRDGYGTGDHKVASADLEKSTILGSMDHVDIPLEIPSGKYLNPDSHNVDLSESNIALGQLRVGMDGATSLNGQPIENQKIYGKECR